MPKVIGDLSSINTMSFSDRRYPFFLGGGGGGLGNDVVCHSLRQPSLRFSVLYRFKKRHSCLPCATTGCRALSRLYSYGRSLYAIQNGCRISHAWIFKEAVCGSWRENTGFQYGKSKEQLLRNTRLLKKRKSVSS